MGQTHAVDVYRLLGANTVDERMIELLGIKSQLFDEYARLSASKDAAAPVADSEGQLGLGDRVKSA